MLLTVWSWEDPNDEGFRWRVEDFKYFANSNNTITIVTNEAEIAPFSARTEGQIFYLQDEKVFKTLNKAQHLF